MVLKLPQILVVGLGNLTHPLTNHSIGHLVLDAFSHRLGVTLKEHDVHDGYYASTKSPFTDNSGQPWDIHLFKPRPPMNLLGKPIAKVLRSTMEDPKHVLVIHDTFYLEKGRMKLKFGGSPEGHRGIRAVNKFMHTQDYFRLQIGIGRSGDAKDYVLDRLDNYMRQQYSQDGEGIDEAWDILGKLPQRILELHEKDAESS